MSYIPLKFDQFKGVGDEGKTGLVEEPVDWFKEQIDKSLTRLSLAGRDLLNVSIQSLSNVFNDRPRIMQRLFGSKSRPEYFEVSSKESSTPVSHST